ncbi:hypothetical protein [Cryptosporangium sp. NPDC051539]|uniref:hypothetical protein n=1 Tax=Cryptosporangium sp. NPDC051539 TaxID=3363962 RepID=UPI003794EB5B
MNNGTPVPPDAELSPEQVARVEYGLARDVLATHRPITGWDTGPDGTRRRIEVCARDLTPWPCDTDTWAMERITDGPGDQPPLSPPACDVYFFGQLPPVTASNGYKRHEDTDQDEDTEQEDHHGTEAPA